MKNLLPQTIKKLRIKKGLTQEQLANKSGMSRGYISRLENDDYKKISIKSLECLANGLDMTIYQLLRYLMYQ